MSVQMGTGFIYRIAKASAEQLQGIIVTHVREGSIFGGAAQWDFNPGAGRDNLRPIKDFTSVVDLEELKGDFGHAFNKDIEVRWKRRDDDEYDVLILSEMQQTIARATSLSIGNEQQWRTRRYEKAAIVQTDNRPAIAYVDYLASNGAVQFQRFGEVKK